jgi:hypothetical protein
MRPGNETCTGIEAQQFRDERPEKAYGGQSVVPATQPGNNHVCTHASREIGR